MLGSTANTGFGGAFGAQNNSTGTGAGSGLFGSAPKPTLGASSTFGAPAQSNLAFGTNNTNNSLVPASTQGQTGAFGAPTTQLTGLFGSKPANGALGAPATSGGLFGNNNNQTGSASGSGFGSSSNPGAPATGSGLFGTSNSTSTSFGQPKPATSSNLFGSQPQNTTGSPFGSAQNKPATGGLFGSAPAATTNTTTGGLFGSNNNAASGTTGGLFGSKPAAPANSGGLFGLNLTTPAAQNLLFGSKPANSTPSSTFGSSGGLFGAKPAATGGGLFGASNATAAPTGGLFAPKPSTSLFSGGAAQQNTAQPLQLTAMTRVGDLPADLKRELEMLDTYINTQHTIATTLHGDRQKHEKLVQSILNDTRYLNTKISSSKQALNLDAVKLQDLKSLNTELTDDLNKIMHLIVQLSTPGTNLSSSVQLNDFFIRKIHRYSEMLESYKQVAADASEAVSSLEKQCNSGYGDYLSIIEVIRSQHALFMELCDTMAKLHADVEKVK